MIELLMSIKKMANHFIQKVDELRDSKKNPELSVHDRLNRLNLEFGMFNDHFQVMDDDERKAQTHVDYSNFSGILPQVIYLDKMSNTREGIRHASLDHDTVCDEISIGVKTCLSENDVGIQT